MTDASRHILFHCNHPTWLWLVTVEYSQMRHPPGAKRKPAVRDIMRELLRELTDALEQGRDCVYCALVETRGSTPQKAGAAMLVFADGGQFGTLGGGCVEAEVKQRALRTLNNGGRAEVLTFNLDSNYGWDDGLICGGRMSVLADPLATGPDGDVPSASYYCR